MKIEKIEKLLSEQNSNPYRDTVPEMKERISFIAEHTELPYEEVRRVMELAHGIYLLELKKALDLEEDI